MIFISTYPISINEAILGSKIAIPTIHGKVEVNVPKGTSSGAKQIE